MFNKEIILNNRMEKEQLLYLAVGILSFLIFCLIYGISVLNPTYTDWLLTKDQDLTQHYLGWKAYRHSKWFFPLGNMDTLAFPSKVSVIYTDSIPLLAVFCKMISFLLPSDFQYFGIWGGWFLCFTRYNQYTNYLYKDKKLDGILD